MYCEFRQEIDRYCFPLLKNWAKRTGCYRYIMCEGKPVGFFMVIDAYIEGIYVEPEYRRRGLAKKAVLDYINEGNYVERLHIVNSNKPAYKFWNSFLDLRHTQKNDCDTLYYVVGIKEKEE